MLEYYEVDPLPEVCLRCMENADEHEDCYNCDYTLERWHLTPESEQRLEELRLKKLDRIAYNEKYLTNRECDCA